MEVWLVEDDARLRDSVAGGLRRVDPELVPARSFGCAGEVLQALERGPAPETALVDLGLPDLPGERVIERLARQCPPVPVLAFTVRFDDQAVFGALRAGAVGYLLKDSPPTHIASALRDAVAGGSPLSPTIARQLVRQFQTPSGGPSDFGLTAREQQVLELLCTGASYGEVARALGMAHGTAHTHVKRLYEKLGVESKAEAVRIAFESRLVALRN